MWSSVSTDVFIGKTVVKTTINEIMNKPYSKMIICDKNCISDNLTLANKLQIKSKSCYKNQYTPSKLLKLILKE